MDTVAQGGTPPGIADAAQHASISGPDTVDGIAPAGDWEAWWQKAVRAKREGAPWANPSTPPVEAPAPAAEIKPI